MSQKQRPRVQTSRRRKELTEDMLKELRAFDPERTDLDEMVALSAFGRSMAEECDRLSMPQPEWLKDRLMTLDREIRLKRQDALEKALKDLEAREESLKTAEQKRKDVASEKEKVLRALGRIPAAPSA